ncbi:hypothetical protein [Streptomyces doebereineriae]|uniref:Uncharacterized protein n=1 Tax=Streptomyces doebereineriae TaxID=3075528 RepID=A0ABU2VH47_9ACTN|nr:hypothetical protein [Streptomyces sp. DSM 41640]MDT0484509.1 hypothetical protein [Streptomyces sp. DSM 41640]
MALVDSPEPPICLAGVMTGAGTPPLPEHFHRALVRELDAARLQVSKDGCSVIVRPVLDSGGWRWRTEVCGGAMKEDSSSQ